MRNCKNNGENLGYIKIEFIDHLGRFEYRLDTRPLKFDSFSYLFIEN